MPAIFVDVQYHIAECIPTQRNTDIKALLDANGAVEASRLTDATHIITTSMEFDGWAKAPENVKIVTPSWVDKCMILGKKQGEVFYSAEPAKIFSGVTAVVAEVSNDDMQILRAGITSLGGQYRSVLTADVTHLITMPPSRVEPLDPKGKFFMAHNHQSATGINIVHPYWFDDCVRTGRHLHEGPYLINADGSMMSGKKLGGEGGPLRFEPSREKRRILEESAKSDENLIKECEDASKHKRKPKQDIWKGKSILLSATLNMEGSKRRAVEESIRRAGGVVVQDEELIDEEEESEAEDSQDDQNLTDLESDSKAKLLAKKASERQNALLQLSHRRAQREDTLVDQADLFITRYRAGSAYKKAVAAHKTIGSLQWLFHVHGNILKGESHIPRPTEQLLWYPLPRRPLVGFENHLITVTNYTGAAREYLKRIIEAMGAEFSPTLSARNTVVIAAFTKGTKTEKARNWNIPVVHHIWLEDCFRQWKNLTVGMEKYVVFAKDKDYSAELAELGVGRGVLEDGVLRELDEDNEDIFAPAIRPRTTADALTKTKITAITEKIVTPAKSDHKAGSASSKSSPSKTTLNQHNGAVVSLTQGIDGNDDDAVDAMLDDDGDFDMGIADVSDSMNIDRDLDQYDATATPSKIIAKGKGKTAESAAKSNRRQKRADERDQLCEDIPGKRHVSVKKAVQEPKVRQLVQHKGSLVRKEDFHEEEEEEDTNHEAKDTPQIHTAEKPTTPTLELTRQFTEDMNLKTTSNRELSHNNAKKSKKTRDSSMDPPLDPETPTLSRGPSKRSAAARAINALHNVVMPDMNNYEKEKRGGFKVKPEERLRAPETPKSASKKRTVAVPEDEENEEEPISREKKKRRISEEDSALKKSTNKATATDAKQPTRILTTGIVLPDKTIIALVKCGAKMTTRPADCTVLVVERYARTPNFLCAIASHPAVVHKDWAMKSAAAGRLLPTEDFLLHDKEGESKFNLSLKTVLQRARKLDGKLFHQHHFYVTSRVPDAQTELIRKVVLANGGQCTLKVPSLKKLKDPATDGFVHIVSCPDDSAIWKPLVKEGVKIYTPEVVLGCGWSQVLDLDTKNYVLHHASHHR